MHVSNDTTSSFYVWLKCTALLDSHLVVALKFSEDFVTYKNLISKTVAKTRALYRPVTLSDGYHSTSCRWSIFEPYRLFNLLALLLSPFQESSTHLLKQRRWQILIENVQRRVCYIRSDLTHCFRDIST